MRKAQRTVRGLLTAGFVGAVAACSGLADATAPASDAATRGGGVGGAPTTGTGSAVVRVRCELRAGRSKISVDGNNLRPLNGTFRADVRSGGNTAASPLATAIGDEAEFDFDSDPGDIREGATPISATFITGGAVIGRILDAQGSEIVRAEAQCEVR